MSVLILEGKKHFTSTVVNPSYDWCRHRRSRDRECKRLQVALPTRLISSCIVPTQHNHFFNLLLDSTLDAGQPESLQDIVASVKYVSGLDIQCVSYPQRQSSLLDALTPNLG